MLRDVGCIKVEGAKIAVFIKGGLEVGGWLIVGFKRYLFSSVEGLLCEETVKLLGIGELRPVCQNPREEEADLCEQVHSSMYYGSGFLSVH